MRCLIPCYEVSTFSVEFAPQNYDMLAKVVREAGGTMMRGKDSATVVLKDGTTITIAGGKASTTARQGEKAVNDLRVAYSQGIVNQAAQTMVQKGWQIQRQGPNKMTVGKR